MGLIISMSAVVLIWGVKGFLEGKSASKEIEQQIRDAAFEVEQVRDVLELATMYLGSEKLLLHLDVEVDKSSTAKELGEVVDLLKEKIKKAVPIVSSIQIETIPAA